MRTCPQDVPEQRQPSAENPALTDENLLARLGAMDTSALDCLFDRYSRLVFRVGLRILHDSGEAEELVQEAFLYVLRKAANFEPSKGSAKAWILQIAQSRALDRRALLTRRGFYTNRDIESLHFDEAAGDELAASRQVEANLDLNGLRRAFKDLNTRQRQTLGLYYFAGLSLSAISKRLGEPLGNVRHHLYRGLDRLRRNAIEEPVKNHPDRDLFRGAPTTGQI